MTRRTVTQLPKVSVSNYFGDRAEALAPMRELSLDIDSHTGLMSLGNFFSVTELRHAHEWLVYREPEEHCHDLAAVVSREFGVGQNSYVAGLSWKDAGFLRALLGRGAEERILFPRTWEIGSGKEHGRWVRDSVDVQHMVCSGERKQDASGLKLISVRHLLEHSPDVGKFLDGVRYMLASDGLVVFEVPDCQDAIESNNYSILWEEHQHYFTANSLSRTLENFGWRLLYLERLVSEAEAIIVAVATPASATTSQHQQLLDRTLLDCTMEFGRSFWRVRARVMARLKSFEKDGTRRYILGANHAASTFLDMFTEADTFEAVLDDSVHKQGRFMSKYSLPIISPQHCETTSEILVVNAIHSGRAHVAEQRLRTVVTDKATVLQIADFF